MAISAYLSVRIGDGARACNVVSMVHGAQNDGSLWVLLVSPETR